MYQVVKEHRDMALRSIREQSGDGGCEMRLLNKGNGRASMNVVYI
jgi:hypothetical protein